MKQVNSLIASLVVSGVIVLSVVGIGANALANTPAAAANTVTTASALNSGTRSFSRSGERGERNVTRTGNTGTFTTNP